MISCEDSSSDAESDSSFEPEVQEYVDSDKADSDIEIELYSQIYYTENISASTLPIESIQNDSCIEVSPIKSTDLLPGVNCKEELGLNAQKGMPGLVKFNSFESSTPKDILNSDLIIGNENLENIINLQMKSPKAKRKRNAISAPTNSKLKKIRNDSGCSESLFSDDDTDDNSVICLDSDDHCDSSSMLMNIKDHIHGELILLDSTATSDESDQNSVFLNLSEDSEDSLKLSSSAPLSVTNKSGDLWRIDHEDRFAHVKKQKRYHEKHNSICNNCKKKGHLSKDCQEPSNMRCYICGGEHGWSTCHQRICGICFNYGHSSHKCKLRACDVLCSLCKMRGHHMPECPDLWRRYHLTTSPGAIVKGSKEVSQGVKKYCYNCGHQGHYGHECLRPRMSPESFPTWPFVISYKDPAQHFKKYLKRGSKEHSAGSGRHHDSYPGHKHNKKHRSQADKLRDMISELSGKQSESSRKSKGKQKNKKHLKVDKYSPVFKGNNFPRSALGVNLDEGDHKSERRKKREMHRMYAFMRKKQKLPASV